MDVSVGLVAQPYYDNDGNQNYIDLGATMNAAYFTGKLNAASDSRWHPIQEIKNVVDERGENILEGYEDNSADFIQEGVRTVKLIVPGTSTTWYGKVKDWNCQEFGVYFRTKSNDLVGSISSDGTKLYPVRVQRGTWAVRLIKSTDKTKQKTEISFQVHTDEDDANLAMIKASEITGYSLSQLRGLIDVNATMGAVDATQLVVTLKSDYGTAINKQAIEGMADTDFELYNVTDTSSVTITGCTESSSTPGEYTITYASQTAADVLRLSLSKNGYEMDSVTGTV